MHSQWGDKQRSVHLHPSQATVGNLVRVLSPGCGWQAGGRSYPKLTLERAGQRFPIPGSFASGWQDMGLGSAH